MKLIVEIGPSLQYSFTSDEWSNVPEQMPVDRFLLNIIANVFALVDLFLLVLILS